jgi:very-short-patch-repair endonuclease
MKFLQNDTLVAIMNSMLDFHIAENYNWYRIPVDSAPPIVRDKSIKYLAFYHTKTFAAEKYSIRWYAKVKSIDIVGRRDLFPDEPENSKTNKSYYKLSFEPLKLLPTPIISSKGRMLIFIPTNRYKLFHAREINDIFNNSPLDNELWKALASKKISAERELYVYPNNNRFCLDFAIFCKKGNINIECDGDEFHMKPDAVKKDKKRNNILSSNGWSVLRFTTEDIYKDLKQSVSMVQETIKTYGGMKK